MGKYDSSKVSNRKRKRLFKARRARIRRLFNSFDEKMR